MGTKDPQLIQQQVLAGNVRAEIRGGIEEKRAGNIFNAGGSEGVGTLGPGGATPQQDRIFTEISNTFDTFRSDPTVNLRQ